jgi:lipoprotein NlpI
MNSATDNDRLTEAYAYVGMNLSLLGQSPEALKHFKWIIEKGNRDFTEYSLALSEIRYLEALPKSTEATPKNRTSPSRKRRP